MEFLVLSSTWRDLASWDDAWRDFECMNSVSWAKKGCESPFEGKAESVSNLIQKLR